MRTSVDNIAVACGMSPDAEGHRSKSGGAYKHLMAELCNLGREELILRNRFALDSDGTLVDAYDALARGGAFSCAHHGCTALVHPQWGPGHKEVFFYAYPGSFHDHSQEGDHTIITIRRPISEMIIRLLNSSQGTPPPKPKVLRPKKQIQPATPMIHIDKYRNISTLQQIYHIGICSTPGFCTSVIDGEPVGEFLTTYIDRQYLFDNLFTDQISPSMLSGPHIMELIPDRITSSGIRAFQACAITIDGRRYHAYINVDISISDPIHRKDILERCFSEPLHMFLLCSAYTEKNRPSLGKDGVWRATYSCCITRLAQIAVCPCPIRAIEKTRNNTDASYIMKG